MEVDYAPFLSLASTIVDNRGRTCPTSSTGIPLIATNCIRNEHLYPLRDKLRYVSQETYDTWFRGHPKPGDIIFVTKGTPGRVCLTPDPVDFCIAQDMVAIRPDQSRVDPRYLFALLRSSPVQRDIENMHVGTLIPHFKKGDFDKLLLPLPPRHIQERIAEVYYVFSLKIELNRQMNETLEAISRRLFKSWFVDFDPVHAKAAVRKQHPEWTNSQVSRAALPNLATAMAELFPDSFEDSTLGLIPRGWSTRPLYGIARFVNGAAFKNSDFCDPAMGKPVVKIAELKAGLTSQTKYSTKDVGPDREIQSGDILYSWSGSPDTSLATFRWTGRDGLLNQHIFKVITENRSDAIFAYYQLTELRDTLIEIARNKQTTGLGHVTVADMKRLHVVHPSDAVLDALAAMVGSQFDLSFNLAVDSLALADVRDKLLPRLLSGDLSVTQEVT